jgi:SAM-dependent methyltransferase
MLVSFAVLALRLRPHRSPIDDGPPPPHWAPERLYREAVLDRFDGWFPRECPLCGHRGYFRAFGFPPRFDALCPKCDSLDRHRLVALWAAKNQPAIEGRRILHFAPEPCLRRLFQPLAASYVAADLTSAMADRVLDITALDLPDESFDVIVCSHVLEHVDDRRALAEMHRVLAPRGLSILLTPVVDAWGSSYEDPAAVTPKMRWLHFGQGDHLRYYGHDIIDRIRKAGFAVARFVAMEPEVSRYGLVRGETVYVASKAAPGDPV